MNTVNFDSAEHAQPSYSRRVDQAEAEQALQEFVEQQDHKDASPVLAAIRSMSANVSSRTYAVLCAALASKIGESNMGHQDYAQAAMEYLGDAGYVIVGGV